MLTKSLGALLFLTATSLFAQETARPPVLGVAHISLLVHDLAKSRAFYHDFLGYQEPYALTKPDGSPTMAFFKINDKQYIELSPESQPHTDRLNHYALLTTDADAMRRYLASRGVKVPVQTPKGRIGNFNFMIQDPEGHSVEIVQYASDGWTMREQGKYMSDQRVSTRMMHVGIIVTKLDSELRFYEDILGFSETWRGGKSDTVLSWVNLRVPDGEDYIELMLYKTPPPETERGSAHHLALEVPNAEKSIKSLLSNSYRSQYARTIEARTGINRKRQVNLFDPDGTRSELMEPVTVDGKPAPSSKAPPPQ